VICARPLHGLVTYGGSQDGRCSHAGCVFRGIGVPASPGGAGRPRGRSTTRSAPYRGQGPLVRAGDRLPVGRRATRTRMLGPHRSPTAAAMERSRGVGLACIGNPDPRDVKVVVGTLQLGLRLRLGRHLGRRSDGEPMPSAPFRVISGRPRHALSRACRAGVLGVAEEGPACLGSADSLRGNPTAATTTSVRLRLCFPRFTPRQPGWPGRGLENRQRRTSLVGSNPTPSAAGLSRESRTFEAARGRPAKAVSGRPAGHVATPDGT